MFLFWLINDDTARQLESAENKICTVPVGDEKLKRFGSSIGTFFTHGGSLKAGALLQLFFGLFLLLLQVQQVEGQLPPAPVDLTESDAETNTN